MESNENPAWRYLIHSDPGTILSDALSLSENCTEPKRERRARTLQYAVDHRCFLLVPVKYENSTVMEHFSEAIK